MVKGTLFPELEHRLPGYGAFKREDVEDARRREPASDLRGYAEACGLEFLDRLNPAGFWGAVPDDSRLQFNVMRGLWTGDRAGVIFHKLLAQSVLYDTGRAEWRATTGADVHELHYKPLRTKQKARELLVVVPVIGQFLPGAKATDPREVAIGIPTTTAAAHVPEAATVPEFRCGNNFYRGHFLPGKGPMDLADLGVPGMELEPLTAINPDPGFLQRLMAGPFGQVLRHYGARPYLRVKVGHGQLSIVVDGYLDDPAELDALAAAVSAAAGGVADAASPMHQPRPFGEPLPGIDWSLLDTDPLKRAPYTPPVPWIPALSDFGRAYNATPEDAVAYHLAFPRLPAPGTAFAVLRFTPPAGSAVARVAWHNEQTIQRFNTGRNVVSLPAAPGAEPTPPGGVGRIDLNLRYAISDGIFCAWDRRDWNARGGLGEMDTLVARALGLARTEGLAQL
jgi:hypothetical protein